MGINPEEALEIIESSSNIIMAAIKAWVKAEEAIMGHLVIDSKIISLAKHLTNLIQTHLRLRAMFATNAANQVGALLSN